MMVSCRMAFHGEHVMSNIVNMCDMYKFRVESCDI